ncbi:amidohydrolase family protein [Streptomyces sp. HD]|uniref:amidohydrolase family protein n=1 Tax=Streptomyces sp. HD TaxID=3020892 RepID=UPI00232FA12C|nr:amidohydrolase family protein [Streptomyces sp. HD]MDC0767823.1 amidohydrolase family protein [Streptomyces sp. HD]
MSSRPISSALRDAGTGSPSVVQVRQVREADDAADDLRAGVAEGLRPDAAQERAAREAGWRLLAGPTFMDVPEPPDRMAYGDRMAWARRDLEARGPACHGRRPVVFAHSTYPLSPGQLTEIAALGREFGALLHIHAAENGTEVATVEVRYGKRPVGLLDSLGLLGPDLLVAHAVELTGPEIAALARTGRSVAHRPVSNLKLGCGIAPVPRLLSAGVTVGLGTDGAVGSNTLDVLGAVRQAAPVHKAGGDPTAVGAERAVCMATVEGARTLGLGEQPGSLEAGKRADLIVLDLGAPHLHPLHDPWSTLAYAAYSADVRDTVVEGRVLMRDRVLTTLDEAAVIADLEAVIADLEAACEQAP